MFYRDDGHNPYFSRWFSAMNKEVLPYSIGNDVTILILVDGFLQSPMQKRSFELAPVTILILVDGFLQYNLLKTNEYINNKSQSLF